MKRMLMLSVSAVLMLAVAVQAETIFETFDSDPTAGSWTTVGTAGNRFTWLDDLTTLGSISDEHGSSPDRLRFSSEFHVKRVYCADGIVNECQKI